MDEMRRASELDAAIREIGQRRDKVLGGVPALGSIRRAALIDSLDRAFAVETTLRQLAIARDKALRGPARIPADVALALRGTLSRPGQAPNVRQAPFSLAWLRRPIAAVLVGCAVITAVNLGVGSWQASRSARSRSPAPSIDALGFESRMEPFTRSVAIGPFNLNTNEPASLQASFLANSRLRFADGSDTPLGLRLDLPVRAALIEDGHVGIP
jgi:hypothetical protein